MIEFDLGPLTPPSLTPLPDLPAQIWQRVGLEALGWLAGHAIAQYIASLSPEDRAALAAWLSQRLQTLACTGAERS